jgi:(heptosyl)LPS beta-1,4-glucosyltransferase
MKNIISAIIIAKNEEEKIGECLESLSWVDEILVIDTGSDDKTIQIATKKKAIVVSFAKG